MPDLNSSGGLTPTLPIATYTATYQINGGTSIAAGTTTAAQAITFTGVLLTDSNVALTYRDAIVLPKGLQLASAVVTADNTITVTFRNNSAVAITPPASATWTAVVYKPFFLVD